MRNQDRCNPKLKVLPIEVARLFATTNFDGDSLIQSLVILSSIAEGDFGRAKSLCDTFVRPEFESAPSYFVKKQFTALVTKVPFPGNNKSRLAKSRSEFFSAERRCKITNKRLRYFAAHPSRMNDDTRVVMTRAREWVRRVLGEISPGKFERLISSSRPGSGVSVGTRNRFRVSLPFKLGDTDLTVTERAKPYARLLVEGSPVWCQLHAEIDWVNRRFSMPYVLAKGNRISRVPKDARTLRTIAIEPALNVCLQLGVHSYIADRLKAFGNDIEMQSRNQNLARIASTLPFGSGISTLDLSQASDSVSIELVRWLLPWDWFLYLDDIRSESGVVDGETILFEKFSSMGNGFTFALETLIYWCLCKAVESMTKETSCVSPSVYGDDIIVPDSQCALLLQVLRFCGFVINHDKSFVLGPFRESCGADWHNGVRVTPQYVRRNVFRCTDVYSLLNRSDPVLNWGPVRQYLLAEHRKFEPVLYGLENEDTSSCLFAPFAYVKGCKLLTWDPDLQTWRFKGWVFKPTLERVPRLQAYGATLLGARKLEHGAQLKGPGVFRLRSLTRGITRDVPRMEIIPE